MEKSKQNKIVPALWEAFLLGWGFGEGKMEESMDNNFFDSFLQFSASNSLGGGSAPCHTVALPNTIVEVKNSKGEYKMKTVPDYEGRYVRYKLHSDEWRKAMLSKKDEFLKLVDTFLP